MALPKTYIHKSRGFSLIEISITLGLMAVLASLGLVMSFNDYRGHSFRSSRDALVSVLQRARAQAMNNECFGSCTGGLPHGVHLIQNGGYLHSAILYQGASFNANDTLNSSIEVSTISAHVHLSGANDVFFKPLSGNANASTTMTLDDGTASSTISIGDEGQIVWTN